VQAADIEPSIDPIRTSRDRCVRLRALQRFSQRV